MAPSADARITTSSVHPKRNAGKRPNPSRMYTYTPPERGNSAASSAYVSAPHNASRPPSTHTPNIGSGAGTRSAMTAGVRKIPLPMVEPTSTATALQKPSRRGRRSPQRSIGVDMSGPNIHFRTHDATLHATRLDRGGLHLPAHHPRRDCPDHRIGTGLLRALAALQRQAAPAARSPDDHRVWTPARGGGGERVGDGPCGVRLVAETGNGKRETGNAWSRGIHSADVTRPPGRAGCRDRQAEPAALDRDPPSRDGDAAARDADCRCQTDPGREPGDPENAALARGVSGPRSGFRNRSVRRAHGQPGGGQRVPGISALQRSIHPGGELPAAHPLDPPAARLHAVRVPRVVGPA